MADKVYPIKLKRTARAYSTVEGAEYEKIEDVVPEYGEAVYNKADATIQVGDGTTALKSLSLLNLLPRAKAALNAFFKEATPKNTSTLYKMVTLTDINSSSDPSDTNSKDIYLYQKCWTPEDSTGIPKDASGVTCKMTSRANGGVWYWTNSSGTKVTITDDTTLPRAQDVPVAGITSSMRVGVKPICSNAERIDKSTAKLKQKQGGMITDIESYNGGVTIICTVKVPTEDCYLQVFGG